MSDAAKNAPRRLYRLPPCPSYDVAAMESWLSAMAEEGLFLCEDGFFFGFAALERGEPRKVQYRLEAAPKSTSMWSENGGEPDGEALELNERYGWHYIAARGEFYIFRADTPDARALHTDPQVQALALRTVRKRRRSSAVSTLLWALVYPLIALRGSVVLTMINLGTLFVLFGAALSLWMFVRSLKQVIHLHRLEKILAENGVIEGSAPGKKRVLRYWLSRLCSYALIGVWIVLAVLKWNDYMLEKDFLPLASYTGDPPFATMETLADSPALSCELQRFGFSNTVRQWSDPLAPCAYDWDELSKVTLADGRTVTGGLHVEYYETAHPFLARLAARETLRLGRKGKKTEPLTLPPLDAELDFAAGFVNELHYPTVVFQKGNKVLRAYFYQTSESRLTLEEWTAALAQSLQ